MIKVNELCFTYGKDKNVLKGLDFSVGNGEIFGFLGPNGAGKSTTQKILTGILGGYKGEVMIGDFSLKNISKDFYQEIGVLFEMPYLYSTLSAIDNLKYFASFYDKSRVRRIDELLNLVELKSGYMKKQVKSYSKGMKQRVSMARAILNSPKILFLDEPVSGLDPTGAVLIKNIIKEEKQKGTTIFLTTHNMYVADELCDRVAFIVNGEIKVIDTPKNLKSTCDQKQIEIEFLINGQKKQSVLEVAELKRGLPMEYDHIVSIHSKEYTLEDVFIRLTGRGLS